LLSGFDHTGEVRILGLVFAGTATGRRPEMAAFARDALGLVPVQVHGADAEMFLVPDGSMFAVAGPRELGETSRSLGFLVADLDEASAALASAGIEVDDIAENERFRYVHFRAPTRRCTSLSNEWAVTGSNRRPPGCKAWRAV
jgi:hypothetical protein